MKVLLVNPPRFEGISVIREERCEITERYSILEPYSLLQTAALLRDGGHQVSLIDLNGQDLGYDALEARAREFHPDATLYRFTPTTFDWDHKAASTVKGVDKDITTVGVCWTLHTMPNQVLKEAPDLDVYVRQDYEVVAPAAVNALAGGTPLDDVAGIAYRRGEEIKVTGPPTPMKDYDSMPIPAYDLLPSLKPYYVNAPAGRPFTILYTSKGCPFKCSFCTVAGTPWKMRTAPHILEELRYLKERYGLRTASFFDETFTFNRGRVEEICRMLKEEDLKIKWYCNTRAHLVDRELLRQMREAGCRGISFGIESGSQRILDSVEKKVKVEQNRDAVLAAKAERLKVLCSFIFGLPGEDWDSVEETLQFVRDTLPTSAQFNVAVPYPGTRLHEQIYGVTGLEEPDFRKMYQHASVVGTEKMTPEDLDEARKKAYKTLYTSGRWWLSNIRHLLREPSDLYMASRFAMKITNNYVFHGMKDAH
ncbi:MAG: radical SAM protein [Methanomassiliicoccus sp.]|nr:radical SAM protein [Methanomassiliicoccus sp.]